MKKEEDEVEVMVFCNDKDHIIELIKTIHRHDAEIAYANGQSGAEVKVMRFAKTSDLNGTTAHNLAVVVLSLIGGKADVPWDVPWLARRFQKVPIIVEIDKNTSQEKALKIVNVWGARYVFGVDDDVGEFIQKILLIENDPPIKS